MFGPVFNPGCFMIRDEGRRLQAMLWGCFHVLPAPGAGAEDGHLREDLGGEPCWQTALAANHGHVDTCRIILWVVVI